jgi:hypothetical protein
MARVPIAVNTQIIAGLNTGDTTSNAPSPYMVTEGNIQTYSAALNAITPAATPTDWLTLQGATGVVARLLYLRLQYRATLGAQYRVQARRYSTLFSGGTPVVVTPLTNDSGDPANSCVLQTWAGGLPTIGGTPIAFEDDSINAGVLGTPIWAYRYEYDYTKPNAKAIYIRTAAQYISLWSNAVALPGGSVFDVKIMWSESPL